MPVNTTASMRHGAPTSEDEELGRHHFGSLSLISSPVDPAVVKESPPSLSSRDASRGESNYDQDKRPAFEERHESYGVHPGRQIFKRRTEANTVELFFDLFFVANLTVFSDNHEIDDGSSLSVYVGFFSILWFTWLQVTIFDARFGADSIFERICKVLHFGVMIGFAVVGPKIATQDPVPTFQQLTIILIASRVLLLFQYTTVLLLTRRYRDAIIPLTLKLVTLSISTAVFIGVYFSFSRNLNGQIGWYVVSVVEALSMFVISSYWTTFSFRNTCLAERVGLLTLIILGEGIIGFSKKLAQIENTFFNTGVLTGMAISSVLITYFLFLLYFDQVDIDRFSTVRQHAWALAHFAIHLGFLLTLEGVNQLALYSVAWQQFTTVIANLGGQASANGNSTAALVSNINATLSEFSDPNSPIPTNINNTLTDILRGNDTSVEDTDLVSSIAIYIFQSYGYEIPIDDVEGQDLGNIISTAYLYLFIAAGGALITLAALLWIGKSHKTRAEYSAIGVRVAVGVALCLSTLLNLGDGTLALNFLNSAWTLPAVMLSLGLVLVLDAVAAFVFRGK